MADWEIFEQRKMPIKRTNYEIVEKGSSVFQGKRKKAYEYFECDYCGKEFRCGKGDWEKREGGVLEYPISTYRSLKIALHNACLKDALAELDLKYRKET